MMSRSLASAGDIPSETGPCYKLNCRTYCINTKIIWIATTDLKNVNI